MFLCASLDDRKNLYYFIEDHIAPYLYFFYMNQLYYECTFNCFFSVHEKNTDENLFFYFDGEKKKSNADCVNRRTRKHRRLAIAFFIYAR